MNDYDVTKHFLQCADVRAMLHKKYEESIADEKRFLRRIKPLHDIVIKAYIREGVGAETIRNDVYPSLIASTNKESSKWKQLIKQSEYHSKKDAGTKIDWEDAVENARRVPIETVCSMLGMELNKNKSVCPLHDEKTPSFSVSPSKNLWHCFGCGEGGDGISLIMKVNDVTFKEAIRILQND